MIRQDLIDFCLTFSAAYEDYPFDECPDRRDGRVGDYATPEPRTRPLYIGANRVILRLIFAVIIHGH